MERKKFIYFSNSLDYIIDYPKEYKSGNKYPVIMYLHGYGFVQKSLDELETQVPVSSKYFPEKADFILVIPKCNEQSWLFKSETLCAFAEFISKRDFCDESRFYLTGVSMGGYAAWLMLQARSNLFAAALICCGGGQYWASVTGVFNKLPIRCVHGKLDKTVLPRESEIMANSVNENGGCCELILYDDLGHDVWNRVYQNKETYIWLLKHKKAANQF